MKLSLSLTSGIIGIVSNDHKKYWALLYFPGAIASFSGSSHSQSPIKRRKWLLNWQTEALKDGTCCWLPPLIVVIFGALYSDWVLAVVLADLSGYPSGENNKAKALW
ncbi:hypothetical protein OCU04_010137 [Sclerotinia nivalis]|uniref:Uncharacterized protein n=1 Tax=Sclerotinia nivalis TaxID=352851 RepID=A0A9X0AE22_9HELO|nr:hypothetical protein OCU04_010137 [Sclerotinia nivalis]